jgi:hypothetical protein
MMAYVGHESGSTGIARMTGKEKRKTRIAITPDMGRVCSVNKEPNKNSRIRFLICRALPIDGSHIAMHLVSM